MKHYQWAAVRREEMNPMVSRQVIHAETMTVARLHLRQGAVVPIHSHPNEQISMVTSGRLRFEVEGEECIVGAGEALQIPPFAKHSVEALDDSEATDLFSPVREDWIRGEDAYLRG